MRSKLFVPGSRPELFAKAMASAADAISIDIEDAVEESQKASARETVATFLKQRRWEDDGKLLIVRVNALSTRHFADDIAALVGPGLRWGVDLINLPMAESADDVRAAVDAIERVEAERGIQQPTKLMINIETPKALRRAAEIASASPRVVGLQLGLADLFEPLGIDRSNASAVQQVQLQMRLAAGEAGVWAYDAAYANVRDIEGYAREAEVARRLGYMGKSCIHPSQIAAANSAFQPSAAEIAHAARVVAATKQATANGIGAYMVDGRMVDAPFARRAAAVLALAESLGLVDAMEPTT
jgi:citrate lyase subunit beta / citryl-CoA lyase